MTTKPAPHRVILGRIDATQWPYRAENYRTEVRRWLLSNGVNPYKVPLQNDVVIVRRTWELPVIERHEVVRDAAGRLRYAGGRFVTRVVRTPLRVPLPSHLNDRTVAPC